MSAYTLNKPTTDPVAGILNYHAYDSALTIQNDTGAEITIEVTNENVQEVASPTWSDPPSGALTIADGAIEVLETPHVAFRASGTGTGNLYIVQA